MRRTLASKKFLRETSCAVFPQTPILACFLACFVLLELSADAYAQNWSLRTVELGWKHVSGALDYEVVIEREFAKPQAFITTKNFWVGQIPCGVYQLKSRSYDQRNVPGAWKEFPKFTVPMREVTRIFPQGGSVLRADDEEEANIAFQWQYADAGSDYMVELFDENGGRVAFQKVSRNSTDIKLPVARRYTWQVQAVNEACPGSDVTESWALALMGPKMETPDISRKDLEDSVEFYWTSRYGKTFALALEKFDEDAGVWKEVEARSDMKDREFEVDSEFESGRYKMKVASHAPLRVGSDFAEVVFDHVQKISQNHLYDVHVSYSPMVKSYSIQNPLINAKVGAFFPSAYQGSFEYSYKERAGAYLEFQEAQRQLKFVNTATNTSESISLRYQRASVGAFQAFRLKKYFIDQIIDVGVRVSYQNISNITSEGTTITTSPTSLTTLDITMFPKVVYFNILVRGYFAAGFLLNSTPLVFESYSNVGVGAAFEKQHSRRLASGAFYRFENMNYDYKDDDKNLRSHIVTTQMFGLYMKMFFW